MAQKSLKALAVRNANKLNHTHLITLGIHLLYHFLRLTVFPERSLIPFVLLSFPALVIEFWLEKVGRPTWTAIGGSGREVKRTGEDMEAKGLTELLWDVIFWTWGCIVLVAVAGDWAWWFMLVVPVFGTYLGITTYTGMKSGMGGLMGGGDDGGGKEGQSKRQAKMEKRGGQQRVKFQ